MIVGRLSSFFLEVYKKKLLIIPVIDLMGGQGCWHARWWSDVINNLQIEFHNSRPCVRVLIPHCGTLNNF